MEDGPPRFPPDCTCPAVLGYQLGPFAFHLPGCHRLWPAFPCRSITLQCPISLAPRPQPTCVGWFRLLPVRSPLLGESLLISFPPGTEMFQFPGFATPRLCIHRGSAGSPCAGCPIRRSTNQSLLAAPRSFSQLSTSFFASCCLGIHRAPVVA